MTDFYPKQSTSRVEEGLALTSMVLQAARDVSGFVAVPFLQPVIGLAVSVIDQIMVCDSYFFTTPGI